MRTDENNNVLSEEERAILEEEAIMSELYKTLEKEYSDYAEEARYYGRVMSFDEYCACA